MIAGRVTQLHALVDVPFLRPDEVAVRLEFVLDTGFTGDLTLPEQAVSALGLVWHSGMEATLADGTTVDVDLYHATVR